MDIELEYEEFKKQHTPSLIGSSVRNTGDPNGECDLVIEDDKHRSTSRPVIKNQGSYVSIPTLDQLKAEGGLIDDDGQLEDILNNDGHIKEEVLPEVIKLREVETPVSINLQSKEFKNINEEEDKIDDGSKITILGGDGDKFMAPASGAVSDYNYDIKKKEKVEPVDLKPELIKPSNITTVHDIIEKVNEGEFEESKQPSFEDSIDEEISKKLSQGIEEPDPVVPDSVIENDSEFTPPAAMRDGSRSRLLEEQRSRSRQSRSEVREGSGTYKPHLARGESYHSALNNDEYVNGQSLDFSKTIAGERRPRHDPNASKITNSSSLNYLRSISRSRSRVANDRKALGEDILNETELQNSGALMNDNAMSVMPDIQEAVNKALKYVEGTDTVNEGQKIQSSNETDIVHNLKKSIDLDELNEQPESQKANLAKDKKLNTDDLLDQLANSAKELMLDDDEDEKQGDHPEITEAIKPEKSIWPSDIEELDPKLSKNEYEEKSLDDTKLNEEQSNQVSYHLKRDSETKDMGISEEEKERQDPELLVSKAQVGEVVGEEKNQRSLKDDDDIETSNKDKVEDIKNAEKHVEQKREYSINTSTDQPEESESGGHKEGNTVLGNDIENTKKERGLEQGTTTVTSGEEEKAEAIPKPECNNEAIKNVAEEKQRGKDNEEEHVEEHAADDKTEMIEDKSNQKVDILDRATVVSNDKVPVEKPKEAKVTNEEDDIERLLAAASSEQESVSFKSGSDGSVFVPKAGKMAFEDEPVYLFTSFAGGFQVTTRTNRLVTILTANRVKFQYKDLGTDEEAKKIWRRYSSGKTLPGIVRGKDDFIGNWQDLEEANEDYAVRSLIYESF